VSTTVLQQRSQKNAEPEIPPFPTILSCPPKKAKALFFLKKGFQDLFLLYCRKQSELLGLLEECLIKRML
jgi:hypothetical protein